MTSVTLILLSFVSYAQHAGHLESTEKAATKVNEMQQSISMGVGVVIILVGLFSKYVSELIH